VNMRVRFVQVLDDTLERFAPRAGKPADSEGTPVFAPAFWGSASRSATDTVGALMDDPVSNLLVG
jgi:hypothetical protein